MTTTGRILPGFPETTGCDLLPSRCEGPGWAYTSWSGGRVGKTPYVLAPLIVGAAVLLLTFYCGRWFERARQKMSRSQVSLVVYFKLVEYLRGLLHPVSLDDPVYLPDATKTRGFELLNEADGNLAAVRKAARRRVF